jgi:predicted DNA-binding antitoxin AbrB/MazE fold protein
MTKAFNAIYEHGVLKPLAPIEGINENTEVKVTISIENQVSHPILRFAGILSKKDADSLMDMVEEEFGRVNLNEWKD